MLFLDALEAMTNLKISRVSSLITRGRDPLFCLVAYEFQNMLHTLT